MLRVTSSLAQSSASRYPAPQLVSFVVRRCPATTKTTFLTKFGLPMPQEYCTSPLSQRLIRRVVAFERLIVALTLAWVSVPTRVHAQSLFASPARPPSVTRPAGVQRQLSRPTDTVQLRSARLLSLSDSANTRSPARKGAIVGATIGFVLGAAAGSQLVGFGCDETTSSHCHRVVKQIGFMVYTGTVAGLVGAGVGALIGSVSGMASGTGSR